MILALIASDSVPASRPLVEWVLKNKNANGSIGLNSRFPNEGIWNTPLLAIAMHHLGRQKEKDAAIQFLLSFRSIPVAPSAENPIDTSLIGWPWVSDTFGWVEPTAWALMALRFAEKDQHPRAIEGRRLLVDRCIDQGGWNYGNKVVYGKSLIPFWDSTALALLSLEESDGGMIPRSLDMLQNSLAEVPSLYSKSLACICLSRFGKNVDGLLEQIGTLLAKSRDDDMNLAHSALGLIALARKRVLTP